MLQKYMDRQSEHTDIYLADEIGRMEAEQHALHRLGTVQIGKGKQLISTLLCLLISAGVCGQERSSTWVDSTYRSLSLEEKVAHLMVLPAYSNKGSEHRLRLNKENKEIRPGGFIFFQGGPGRQIRLVNQLQDSARVPLLIGIDAEWGLDMRLDSVMRFPWAMTLGAVDDSSLLYELGREWGRQCKRTGVNWNFAPVLDLNTNPKNPIINARSFGETSSSVLPRAMAVARGMEDEGVISCIKHFPGHGDTDSDSHKTLPTVKKDRQELDRTELIPFRKAVVQNVHSLMVAHLNMPALTGEKGLPTSLSHRVVTELLQEEFGFQGLVVTDALNMSGADQKGAAGEIELRAFLAGNDILLFPREPAAAIEKICSAIRADTLLHKRLAFSVKKILRVKEKFEVGAKGRPSPKGWENELHHPLAKSLNRELCAQALTVLENKNAAIPWEVNTDTLALLTIGRGSPGELPSALSFYGQVAEYRYAKEEERELLDALGRHKRVLVAYYTQGSSPWKPYAPSGDTRSFLRRLGQRSAFSLALFANPYSLNDFPEAEQAEALIMAYQNMPEMEWALANVLYGNAPATGKLPVRASRRYPAGHGLKTPGGIVLGPGLPEQVGMRTEVLQRIETAMDSAISERMFPGAQVLVARRGKIVFEKAYGFHTYNKERPVQKTDLYDLASITKVAATTLTLMDLVDKGKLTLDQELGDIYPASKGSNKEQLQLREILAHQAGLKPWIPFYLETMEDGVLSPELFTTEKTTGYSVQVADGLYVSDSYRDSIVDIILGSALRKRKEYKYSDLGYYLFLEFIRETTGQELDEYVREHFYGPMGLQHLLFDPLDVFPKEVIIPTEDDTYFRQQLIHGHVHDQGAALLGGVGGHAGLFGNARDLSRLMFMLINEGRYGDRSYLDPTTIEEFTRCQYCEQENRRGAGFDKPQLDGEGPTCGCLSMNSFGHSGFTGTLVWADPDEELIYVFLSNRIHPSAENTKLIRSSLRTRIQRIIYNAIEP